MTAVCTFANRRPNATKYSMQSEELSNRNLLDSSLIMPSFEGFPVPTAVLPADIFACQQNIQQVN
jgi:hypothetical protein